MNVRYDVTVDAAYIRLKREDEHLNFSHTYCCDPAEVGGQIHLDFDKDGRLIGIEVLCASRLLPLDVLPMSASLLTTRSVDG